MKTSENASVNEDFMNWMFEPQVTIRTVPAVTGDVFDRVEKFVQLYAQLPAKPKGAALLYQEISSLAPRYSELDQTLVVGRLPKSERNPNASDLAIEDAELSRKHFQIDLSDGFYILRDLDSRNGTYLNNCPDKVQENVLKAGDVIRAGASLFIFAGVPFTTGDDIPVR